jgi:hypothetical protein
LSPGDLHFKQASFFGGGRSLLTKVRGFHNYPEKKHGLFTYILLKGLRGEARQGGRLRAAGLGNWVQNKIRQQARRQGREQTPVLMGDRGGLVLTRL